MDAYAVPKKDTRKRPGRPPGRKNNSTLKAEQKRKEEENMKKSVGVPRSYVGEMVNLIAHMEDDKQKLISMYNHPGVYDDIEIDFSGLDREIDKVYGKLNELLDKVTYEGSDFPNGGRDNSTGIIYRSKSKKSITQVDLGVSKLYDVLASLRLMLDMHEEITNETLWNFYELISKAVDMIQDGMDDISKSKFENIEDYTLVPELNRAIDNFEVNSRILVEYFNSEEIETRDVMDRIYSCRGDLEEIEEGLRDLEDVAMGKSKTKKSVSFKGYNGTWTPLAKSGHYTMWKCKEEPNAYNIITQTKKNSKTGKLVEKIIMEDVDEFKDEKVQKMFGVKNSNTENGFTINKEA